MLTGITTGNVTTSIYTDNLGNLTNDGTWTYTWKNGSQLATSTKNGATWTYTYDAGGMRTERSNGITTYTYTYDGGKLTQMKMGGSTMCFTYGINGHPVSLNYDGIVYYYVTNAQGDVVAILNSSGQEVVSYTYDAWGNMVKKSGSLKDSLGTYNPLRYRGYVYDRETGLYCLQSRYYNPTICRFISADSYISTGQHPLCFNMFIYCYNNPINYIDAEGTDPVAMQWWAGTMWWLCGVDGLIPAGDILYSLGIVILGFHSLTKANDLEEALAIPSEEGLPVYLYKEHTKGARQSTKARHQKGQTRKNRDNRGEKGDARRYYLGNKKKLTLILFMLDNFFDEERIFPQLYVEYHYNSLYESTD